MKHSEFEPDSTLFGMHFGCKLIGGLGVLEIFHLHIQASQANQLMLERRLDPCMSEVFPWSDIPGAHEKMLDNKHLPGNMAVLVTSPKPGLRTVEDVLEAGPLKA